MARLLFFAPLLAVVAVGVYYVFLKSPPPLPDIDLDAWWGPEKLRGKQDISIRPFEVSFDKEMIKDLTERIKKRRNVTPPLEGVGFEYGFNSKQLDNWVNYWVAGYPFSDRVKLFNRFPQFKTNIQGLDIHYIRVRAQAPNNIEVLPILVLHGWPGSVREFIEAIPLLTAVSKTRDYALEVIVPSLPGYGFSDAAVRPGLGAAEMAVVMRNLMHRLGYKQYYVQGGDWGAVIGSHMATFFPKEVLGFHTNMPMVLHRLATFATVLGSIYPPLLVDSKYEERMYPLSKVWSTLIEELGYFHLQATKPDTIGVALTDSPVGLLVYILEKFSTWTVMSNKALPDGGLSNHFTKDQLLDNIMVYWTTKSITTSMRLYSETFNKRQFDMKLDQIPTPVPTWCIQARYEIAYQPPFLLKMKYPNLVNVTTLDDGGHFLAFEKPKVFSEDVIKAVGEFRKLHKQSGNTEL